MANTNILLQDSLGKSQAAENARSVRKTKSWRMTQQGGLMYASEGRQMAKIKAKVDLAKAQALVKREEKKAERKEKEEEAQIRREEINREKEDAEHFSGNQQQ